MRKNFLASRISAATQEGAAPNAGISTDPATSGTEQNPGGDVNAAPPAATVPATTTPPAATPAVPGVPAAITPLDDGDADVVIIENPEDATDDTIDADEQELADDDAAEAETIDQLNESLVTQGLAYSAVAQFGLNPSAVAIGQATGLLDGTSIETMGCEAFGDSSTTEAQMGVEALGGKVVETAASLGRDVLSHAGNWASRLVGAIDSAYARIGVHAIDAHAAGKAFAEKGANAAKHVFSRAATRAEPVTKYAAKFGGAKGAMAIVAAIAATAGVVALAMRAAPRAGASAAEQGSWFGKIRAAIGGVKWPFGKLSVEPEKGATGIRAQLGRLFCGGKPAKSAESSAAGYLSRAGEWTREAFESMKNSLAAAIAKVKEAIVGAGQAVKSFVTGEGDALKSLKAGALKGDAGGVKGIMGKAAHVAGITAVLALLGSLVYFVVVGGLHLIRRSTEGSAA